MVTSTVLPKVSATIIFLALLLMCAYPALAVDATTSATTRKERVMEKVEVRKEKVAERIESLKDKMASREAALKLKLDKFRDKKKAQAAERINTNLNHVNQIQTQEFQKHLEQMLVILTRAEAKGNTGSSVTEAKTAISNASAAVTTQAEKDYSVTISSEATVKTDAQKVRDQLHADLKAVRKQVMDARQAVVSAIKSNSSEGGTSGQ